MSTGTVNQNNIIQAVHTVIDTESMDLKPSRGVDLLFDAVNLVIGRTALIMTHTRLR